MTTRMLAAAAAAVTWMETRFREQWAQAGEDLAEKDQALIAARHATALRTSLERWITVRAARAA